MTTIAEQSVASTRPEQGDRFQCEQCGMELEIINACTCEEGAPAFFCCRKPLVPSGQALLTETKDAFVERMQQGLDSTKHKIELLKKKAGDASDTTKEQISRETAMLSQQYEQVKGKLADVKQASGDAWRDLAKGFSESWQQLKAAGSQAISRYRDDS